MRKLFWSTALWVLGVLTGCGTDEPPYVEYGMPHARYLLSGRTVESGTALLIRGIRVRLGDMGGASARSDSAGRWLLDANEFPCDGDCALTAFDDDGPANGGAFDSLTVAIDPRQTGRGDGHWFEGTFTQADILFELHRTGRK